MKTYFKPKSINIKIDLENILAGSEENIGGVGEFGAKRFSFKITDDTDDWSEEDYY